jgi:hypothetical protein
MSWRLTGSRGLRTREPKQSWLIRIGRNVAAQQLGERLALFDKRRRELCDALWRKPAERTRDRQRAEQAIVIEDRHGHRGHFGIALSQGDDWQVREKANALRSPPFESLQHTAGRTDVERKKVALDYVIADASLRFHPVDALPAVAHSLKERRALAGHVAQPHQRGPHAALELRQASIDGGQTQRFRAHDELAVGFPMQQAASLQRPRESKNCALVETSLLRELDQAQPLTPHVEGAHDQKRSVDGVDPAGCGFIGTLSYGVIGSSASHVDVENSGIRFCQAERAIVKPQTTVARPGRWRRGWR